MDTTTLEQRLATAMAASLLPGEAPPSDADLTAAAAFLLDVAAQRRPGEPAIRLESVSDGRRYLRIAIINEDMPFLVDSSAVAIAETGLVVDRLVHPVIPVQRDDAGRMVSLGDGQGEGVRESMIYIETGRIDAKARRVLEDEIVAAIGDVHAAVNDWDALRAALRADADRLEGPHAEGATLLRWLGDGMVTQLGHLIRRRDTGPEDTDGEDTATDAQAGVCRNSTPQLLRDESYAAAFEWFDRQADPLAAAPLVIKANRIAKVHRRVPLDLFIVPVMEGRQVAALSIHAGIWTSAALASAPADVPMLREQFDRLLAKLGFERRGHSGKALTHALTALPHDLAVGFSEADIERVATVMMGLADRPRPKLALVEAPLARHLFAFVWLPRDMLSTGLRTQIADLLCDAAKAELLDWSVSMEGGNIASLRYVLDIRDGAKGPDAAPLEERLQQMLRGWREAVESELSAIDPEAGAERHDDDRHAAHAAALAERYAEAFPTGYRGTYGAAEAARDIDRLRRLAGPEHSEEAITAEPGRDARLYRLDTDPEGQLRLKVYQHGGALPLSDAVPVLENFGFRVIAEIPTQLAGIGTIHDFTLALPTGESAEPLLGRCDAIEEAIATVLNGGAENDPFNRLVVGTALTAQDADFLRACYRYMRQAGQSFTIYTVVDALRRAPQVAHALVDLFVARHDPGFTGDRDTAVDAADEAIRVALIDVSAINDDRLLRFYHALVQAILRTNAFAPAAAEALALKIDSAQIPALPRPVPWREIFVYSRRVEGIHLRAGAVARGGIRWSDRRDDFRTEVLGLMKAQRVKNAVIVPTGAKGGFYPKQLPDPAQGRDAWAAEGRASYEVFIRALLSITDNIVDDAVVHPDAVIRHDADDPYFVVAADKGTASFSDLANAIAEGRGFWLDDAFASGGSHGYDHKAMGITARGAWISVQRHFRELGVDVQAEPIKVAGVGDMSGDVFGNGMLLSRTLKLVAAFDHRHIFIDPDPDPAASFAERRRLFDLPRSSWDDYDRELISAGGGVWPRTDKRIELSAAAARAIGAEGREFDPESLIAAILRSPVDLLWFGGIGTYVKAAGEANVAVGDPANDGLRVDAQDVRAKAIGEGANLGITQAGRIEFALNGGRINTDFIDNSAGVDCSDNEVNIKIALGTELRAGSLTEERRNALLVEMTDDVAAIVLEDNRLQTLALSIAEQGGAQAAAAQMRLIETLEDMGELDRRTEGLASGETLSRRATEGVGLTRPELAVLLSNAKLVLQDAIETGGLPRDPGLVGTLLDAFPEPMREHHRDAIESHRLRAEIIATKIANKIVNRLGMVHPFELAEEEGATLEQVAAAFIAAVSLFKLNDMWSRIDVAPIAEPARLMLFARAAHGVRSQMADLLRAGIGNVPSEVCAELGGGIDELALATGKLLAAETRQQSARLRAQIRSEGAGEDEAALVAHLFDMDGAVGLARLARDTGLAPAALTAAFTELGARLGLDWAQSTAAVMTPSDPWERLLVSGLARDFQQMRLEFLRRLARNAEGKADPRAAVARWAEDRDVSIGQFRAMIARAQAATPVAPAMLAQVASQARNLLTR